MKDIAQVKRINLPSAGHDKNHISRENIFMLNFAILIEFLGLFSRHEEFMSWKRNSA